MLYLARILCHYVNVKRIETSAICKRKCYLIQCLINVVLSANQRSNLKSILLGVKVMSHTSITRTH